MKEELDGISYDECPERKRSEGGWMEEVMEIHLGEMTVADIVRIFGEVKSWLENG